MGVYYKRGEEMTVKYKKWKDLIYRTDAINVIAEQMMYESDVEYGTGTSGDDLALWIEWARELFDKKVPNVKIPTWIPCERELPSDDKIILIQYNALYAGKWERGYSTTRYINGRFIGYDYDGIEVVAWMPIQPYREGE